MPKKPKRKNLKPPGRCIFFDEEHVTKRHEQMSKEHLFGDWMSALFPDQPNRLGNAKLRIDTPSKTAVRIGVGIGSSGRALIHKQLRCVCISCNSGWMHEIEDAAIPILTAIIGRQPIHLDLVSQKNLATWIALKTVIYDQDDQEYSAITRNERMYLMKNLCPPSNWTISLAKRQISGGPISVSHQGLKAKLLPGAPVGTDAKLYEGQSSTIFIGDALFHVFSHSYAAAVEAFRAYAGDQFPWARLWPPAGDILWPPNIVFSPRACTQVAYGIGADMFLAMNR